MMWEIWDEKRLAWRSRPLNWYETNYSNRADPREGCRGCGGYLPMEAHILGGDECVRCKKSREWMDNGGN